MSASTPQAALDTQVVIGVIGAGAMGAGIAQVAATAGYPVRLYDARPEAPAQARDNIRQVLEKQVAKGKLTAEACATLLERIQPCTDLSELAPAGLVVEAVVEDLEIKRRLFRELEGLVSREAILATNTSSLSITALAAGLAQPGRLVGMHFFNPVPLMALVEVISGLATDPGVVETVFATALAWGKEPVRVRSTPGFIVNRVARPFYAEALRVLNEQGADPATLDAVMREAGGFRMGPLELTDLIGHDVNFAVTRSVYEAYWQDPRFKPSLIQQELVAGGFLGRKSGRGFYDYGVNATKPTPHTAPTGLCPRTVTAYGELGPLEELLPLIGKQCTLSRETAATAGGWLELDGCVALALTDGRTAAQRFAEEGGLPLVLLDLALDYAKATRVALTQADRTDPAALALAAGLMQALGKQVSVLDDVPGLIVMRTVCMLANEGADTVNQGVCSAQDVDLAMRKGVNYPRGPLAWAEQIGIARVVQVLNHLAVGYGEDRYRVSPWLRRKLYSGGRLV